MKGQFLGNTKRGVGTLEILIASAVLLLSITAALLIVFGTQTLVSDARIVSRALRQATTLLERAHAVGQDIATLASVSEVWVDERQYVKTLRVEDYTPCQKYITSEVVWGGESARTQRVSLQSFVADVAEALALGGDCGIDLEAHAWTSFAKAAGNHLPVGDIISIDELNGMLYVGGTQPPYFFIADVRALGQDQSITFVSHTFAMQAPVTAIDAAVWHAPSGDIKQYAFVALDATSSQMAVIDVTDATNPIQVASRTLRNVSAEGSEPAGNLLYYYKDRVYVFTRYTAGPEMHIFDVSIPTNPVELGSGIELGVTVNGVAVQDRTLAGTHKRFAYMATSQLAGELKVYDVTDPAQSGVATEVAAARQDLPGAQNGLSVYAIGNKVYVGRASTPTGPDLYVFDATNPLAGMQLVTAQNVDTGISALVVQGPFIFMLTPKSKKEIQIWHLIGDEFSEISTYPMPGATIGGFDAGAGVLYVTGQGTTSVAVLKDI